MEIEFKIDYLQFSSPILPRLYRHDPSTIEKRSNKPFYKRMIVQSNGALAYHGNPKTNQYLIVWSGVVCDKLITSTHVLRSIFDIKGKVSRIDLAMTTDEPILQKIQDDRALVVSEKFSSFHGIVNDDLSPETIYFGDFANRGKKGIVRAYDKALELNLDGLTMHRIEIELKRNDAHLAARRIESGEFIPEVMNSKFMIDTAWYHEIFGYEKSTKRFKDRKPEENEIEKKMYWLEKQVLPSLQYVLDYDKANGTNYFSMLIDKLDF